MANTQDDARTFQRVAPAQSVADRVVSEVEAMIKAEELTPGHRIGTRQELCEQFGVAPATLGEALRVLRARGSVDLRPGPGGGIFVADQSPLIRLAHSVLRLRQTGAPVHDVVKVLDALDEAVMGDAVVHRTDADIADLDALMAEIADHWHDPVEGLHGNWRLHRRIAEISPNAVLRTFYLNLVDYIEGETSGSTDDADLSVPGFRPDTDERLHIHTALIEAIRSGDVEAGRKAVLDHRTLGR
ncbi:FadR/GntR family transcriptional regulator [Microbacterium sp. CGR1]|uniref:FadR/GntR family transcriptional regulator n=1 Tax=Microbacterium sp. CGR1 TaxID=1696072 RepID=UPI003DA4662A